MQQVESLCGGSKRQKRRSGYAAADGGGEANSYDMLIDQVYNSCLLHRIIDSFQRILK